MDTRSKINLFHILVVAPLLFYVGYNKYNTPEYLFTLLILIAILVVIYHGYTYLSNN